MPTYRFRVDGDDREYELELTMSEREAYLAANPYVRQVPNCTGALLDPIRMGRQKPDDGFRDVLRDIKDKNPGSTIDVR